MPILRINTTRPSIVFDQDGSGLTIDRSKAANINVMFVNEIDLPNRTLTFRIIVVVPKQMAPTERESEAIAANWLAQKLPTHFQNASYWNFFETKSLSIEPITTQLEISYAQPVLNIALSPQLSKIAEEACVHLTSIEAKFNTAIDALNNWVWNSSARVFAETVGPATIHLQTIEQILSASADTGGYGSEDARHAAAYYAELARRKVETNRNYQNTLTSLQTFISRVRFPHCWRSRPYA
jgi:hypothetical protein